ncbi:hypothetical protein GQ600_16666 [Phytophthora cactorum]|nr:hypothetical protein GQ600_16666 [Phytophthora cactorum]
MVALKSSLLRLERTSRISLALQGSAEDAATSNTPGVDFRSNKRTPWPSLRSFQPPVANTSRACSTLARAFAASASSASSSPLGSTEVLDMESVDLLLLELKYERVLGDGVVCETRPEELKKLVSSEHVNILREEMPELLKSR